MNFTAEGFYLMLIDMEMRALKRNKEANMTSPLTLSFLVATVTFNSQISP